MENSVCFGVTLHKSEPVTYVYVAERHTLD